MPGATEAMVGGPMALERLRAMLNIPPGNRPPEWINPLEKIEQLLTCAICLDRYKNPKLLPCQHSFCMEPCLDGLIDIVRRLVRCPECRAEHPLPYDGVKAFQTNYTLMGFLEIHLQATEDNAQELESYIRRFNMERCKVCDEKSEVDYCPHCEKRVCLECKATHVDMLKRDLGRLMAQVKRLCTRITDTAETLTRGGESLSVNCDNSKEEIRDYVKRYIKELKKREDALIAEVDAFHNAEQRTIKTVRDNLELESSNINEACARVDACLKGEREMSDEELVRFKQIFTDGLEYLRTVNPDADELTNKKIRFVVNDAHLLPHAITQFGELQVCTPQYNHKLAHAEHIYVPRFLQLGLESDNYATKRRTWDPNDSNTWQQGSNKGGGASQGGVSSSHQQEDAYSSRYRRRQLLEEQAWNRIRGENPRARQHSPKRNICPEEPARPTSFDGTSPWARVRNEETAPAGQDAAVVPALAPTSATLPPLPSGGARRLVSPQKSGLKPPQTVVRNESMEDSAPQPPPSPREQEVPALTTTTTARSKEESGIPRLSPRTSKPPPSPSSSSTSGSTSTSPEKISCTTTASEASPPAAAPPSAHKDKELDQRVANIRKEHEKRQQDQQKTILQIQQRVRTHHLPVDASAAPEASSEEEEEEEISLGDEPLGEAIPVHVYPKPQLGRANSEGDASLSQQLDRPLHVNTSDGQANPAPADAARRYTTAAPVRATIAAPQQPGALIDWKKYLIPSPTDPRAPIRRGSSSDIAHALENTTTTVGTTSGASSRFLPDRSITDDSSWDDRRRRFVRSKTNPDFSSDVTSAATPAEPRPTESTTPARRRYGLRGGADAGQSPDTTPDTTRSTTAASAKTSRYRRKAERSHSGYVSGALSTDDDRFEVSIGGNNNTNGEGGGGPGARFYRVFTNPKLDYLSKNRCVLKFGTKGNVDGQFNWPRGLAVMPTTEEIVVCDSSNHRLQIFDKRGRFSRSIGTYGSGRGEFDCLAGVCINKYRQFVVTDRYNHRVQIFDSNGRHLREFGAHGQTNGRFNSPWGCAVDQQGFIYVCDKDNHRVQIFQTDGNFVGKFGGIGNREGQFQNPHFVACNRQNQIIVTDSSNHRVQIFDHNGHFLFAFGSEGFNDGQFKYPRGVAVDEQGFISVADSGNNRIQIFYPDGRFYACFGQWGSGDGQLKGVEGLAVTPEGKIILSDRENHRIQIF